MLDGLTEREQLRQAFGSYVDPDVAERVLAEGELLEGQEVEVTVLFVDVRDFTPFAERSSARETVAFLNEFFDCACRSCSSTAATPTSSWATAILGVFGAPERLGDHADRALAAACEIARGGATSASATRCAIGRRGELRAGRRGIGGRRRTAGVRGDRRRGERGRARRARDPRDR